jgi:hypothetical protein
VTFADEVNTLFAHAALDGEIGFAAWGGQRNRRARTDGPTGHFINCDAAQAHAPADLLNTHLVVPQPRLLNIDSGS